MFQKRNPPVGARPGTLAIPPGSPPPKVRAFAYSKAGFEEHEPKDLAALRNDRDRVNWIDVQGMGDEDQLWQIANALGIHPLAIEDAVNAPQRAKAELYDEHMLVIARTPVRNDAGRLEMVQVSLFVGKGYVVTFQERRLGLFEPIRERIRSGTGPMWNMGADYLAYALIDALIDRYYPLIEDIVTELDDLETEVIDEPSPEILPDVYRLRRELVLLRRVGWPQRAAIHDLAREASPFIGDDVRVYMRDTYDHIAQIVELVDSSRDVTMAVMDMYLTNVSNRTNDIMKVLTLMASIFIPLTFLAGIYGMNFDHMPELHKPWAYPVLLGIMAGLVVVMVGWFWRRGWIGAPARRRRRSKPSNTA